MNWKRTHETRRSKLKVGDDTLEIVSHVAGAGSNGIVWIARLTRCGFGSGEYEAATTEEAESAALLWAKDRLAKEIAKLSAILGDVHKEADREQSQNTDRDD